MFGGFFLFSTRRTTNAKTEGDQIGDHEWLRRRGDIGFFHIRGTHVCNAECTGNPSYCQRKAV